MHAHRPLRAAAPAAALDVETRVRCLVADHLGVDADALERHVSLTDDLAADWLYLVEIRLAIERDLGLALARRLLDEVRTCGQLVDAALAVAGAQRPAAPPLLRARLVASGWTVERVVALTPYAAEIITEDAVRAGEAAHLELTVVTNTRDGVVAWVRDRFAPRRARGIRVDDRHVRRRARWDAA